MLKDESLEGTTIVGGSDISEQIAEEGLRYVNDRKPGFTRKRRKAGFHYFDTAGKRITDPRVLARVKSIGVPPAYEFGLDLPVAERPYPGDRARCARAQAIPLSRQVARPARPDQI